jgi:hypothetical protein
MNHIAIYLERFKNLHTDFNKSKEMLAHTIEKATGLVIPISKLTEKNGIVRIECDPIERSVMLEHKESLQEKLKELLNLERVKIQ